MASDEYVRLDENDRVFRPANRNPFVLFRCIDCYLQDIIQEVPMTIIDKDEQAKMHSAEGTCPRCNSEINMTIAAIDVSVKVKD